MKLPNSISHAVAKANTWEKPGAITAGCDVVSISASIVIGSVSAVFLLMSQAALEAMHIDDVVAAFPVVRTNCILTHAPCHP